jgi:hypothetical protein
VKTFVVRLWAAYDDDTPDAPLRGTVERVGSDRSSAFRSDAELVALLRRSLARSTDVPGRHPTEGGSPCA